MTPRSSPSRLARLLNRGDAAFGRAPVVVSPARAWLWYAALGLAGIAIAFLRVPPGSIGLLWAEDAGVFLEDAYRLPLGDALFTGYAGYAHLVPRLVAAGTAATLPIDAVPVATSVVMAVLTSALGLAIFGLSGAHLRSHAARGILWLLVVAAPVAGLELALSSANFQWYLLAGAFWAVFGRRATAGATAVSALLLASAIGSSAIALLFLPLALWRALRFRTRHDVIPAAVALLAAAFQLWVILHSTRDRGGHSLNPVSLVGNYDVAVVGGAWAGPQAVYAGFAVAPVLVVVAAAALGVVSYLAAWRMRRTTPVAAVALVLSWVYLVPVLWLTGNAGPDFAGWFNPAATGSRYGFFAIFLVGVAIVAIIDDRLADRPTRGRRAVAVILIALQLIAVVLGYRSADPRAVFLGGLPAWPVALETGRAYCADHPGGTFYLRGSADSEYEWDSLGVACDVLVRP